MIEASQPFCTRKPSSTHIDAIFASAVTTVIVTMQGMQFLYELLINKGANYVDTLSIRSIFFPLASGHFCAESDLVLACNVHNIPECDLLCSPCVLEYSIPEVFSMMSKVRLNSPPLSNCVTRIIRLDLRSFKRIFLVEY